MRKAIQTTATVGLSAGQSSGIPQPIRGLVELSLDPTRFFLKSVSSAYISPKLSDLPAIPANSRRLCHRLAEASCFPNPPAAWSSFRSAPHTLSMSQFLQYTNCRSFLTRLQNPPVPHALLSAGQASCLPNPPAAWSSSRSTPKFYLLMNFQLTPAKTTWSLRFRDLRYLAKDFAGYHLAHDRGDKRRRA